MNFVSKVKKIAICGVASLGILVLAGNIGLSAMYPFQFPGLNMTNHGNDFTGFSSQNTNTFYQNAGQPEDDSFMDVEEEEESQPPVYQEHSSQPSFQFCFQNDSDVPTQTFVSPEPERNEPYNVTVANEILSSVSARGCDIGSLSEKEKIELTKRGSALLKKGKTWDFVSGLVGVPSNVLRIWIAMYESRTAHYSSQEKTEHVAAYLRERVFDIGVTIADYAERNGLDVSEFENWVKDSERGFFC